MLDWFNQTLDRVSEYLAARKGLLPLLGALLVFINLVVRLAAPGTWLAESDLLLHLGVILAILGILLAFVL